MAVEINYGVAGLPQSSGGAGAVVDVGLVKADLTSPAFTKTGAGTISVKAGTSIVVAGVNVAFASDTPVTMPTLTAGTDYAVFACSDGAVVADASWTAPTGHTTANSRRIGGFHYAPGGNAAAQSGGDTTPAINPYSLWDLRFRPACADPRGMTLVAGQFWADIYMLGVNHIVDGTSKYNVTIADGSAPPKIPTQFGGDGSAAYTGFSWLSAWEVMISHGKRLPTVYEFYALAYGTTEASAGGTDPVSTILRAAYTSRWGVMLATGNLWQWGADPEGLNAAASWAATGGRGSSFMLGTVPMLGNYYADAANSGSRCVYYGFTSTASDGGLGARGVCGHWQG